MKDLPDIVHEPKEKGVALCAAKQPMDTGTVAGKAVLDMLSVFAEFETNLRRERQLEGIKAADAFPRTRIWLRQMNREVCQARRWSYIMA